MRRARPIFPGETGSFPGLSLGVVVVEAELRSGSLITARLAGEQGREVLAVPGSPSDPRAQGCNALLRQGAALVEGVDDVVNALGSGLASRPTGVWRDSEDSGEDDANEASPELVASLASLLSPTPAPIDELARAAGAPIASVLAALVELNLAGSVRLLPGALAVRA